jgi:dTDP-glucose 4,6-dehydratase
MYKVFVIGSNSFSGATFIDLILKQGCEVIGISRSKEYNPVFLPYGWNNLNIKEFSFYQLDLNHDLEKIFSLINDKKPACIVNFSSQSMVAESWSHPEHWFQTNVVATIRLHDFLRKCLFWKSMYIFPRLKYMEVVKDW